MEFVIVGKLVAILFLVAGNAFFVGSEIAITAARRSRIIQLADMGNGRAKAVQKLHEEPTRFYAVTQIGITLVSMALGAIGMSTLSVLFDPMFEAVFPATPEMLEWAHIASWTLAFLVISFLHIVAGELAPKVLAYHKSEQLSIGVGWLINILYITWIPIIWLMNHASNYLLIACGQGDIVGHGDGHGDSSSITLDELTMVVTASTADGSIKPDQGRMLQGVFDLEETSASEAMVSRAEMHSLRASQTVEEAMDFFARTNHLRYPVFADEEEKVVGVLVIKKLIHLFNEIGDDPAPLLAKTVADVMRKTPMIVGKDDKLSSVLAELRKQRRQIAVVTGENDEALGVVTPDNIMSRLIGEYQDEFAPSLDNVRKLQGSEWEISGGVRLSDLQDYLKIDLPADPSYKSLSGLVFHRLGRNPQAGDEVFLDNSVRIQVVEDQGLNIRLARMTADKSGLADSVSPADPVLEEINSNAA
ncbi:MAG: HlyC/CorC family transporter [Magnetococcales bacterium]|nr:HlyC/CorC family transporter [Magnetococcales bacterium]